VGTVLAYVFYWIAVVAILVGMKWREGRTTLMGRESEAGVRRRARREAAEAKEAEGTEKVGEENHGVAELPR
jgi:high-affinity iron transporter